MFQLEEKELYKTFIEAKNKLLKSPIKFEGNGI
jgi:hypothetical protein